MEQARTCLERAVAALKRKRGRTASGRELAERELRFLVWTALGAWCSGWHDPVRAGGASLVWDGAASVGDDDELTAGRVVEALDLRDMTMFMQDWGGPIGLINAVAMPERVLRLAILNTWLHHEGYNYSPAIKAWRDAATNRHWLAWTRHDLPCGPIVRRTAARPVDDPVALERAYEAPFEGSIPSKAGARRFPWCIPFAEPEAGAADRQAAAFEALKSWSGPVNVIFGDADPIFTAAWGEEWSRMIPGATFDAIERAGHFCQEDAGEVIVECLLRRVAESL